MTPLFKKYEQAARSQIFLFCEGNSSRRRLFKAALQNLHIGENFRFLDVIRLAVNEGVIQSVIHSSVVAGFQRHLFTYRHARLVDVDQLPYAVISAEPRVARHNVGLQAGLLLVNAVFHKRAFMAMNDKFRVVNLHQMAGFDDRFQVAIKQLSFKRVIGIGFIA